MSVSTVPLAKNVKEQEYMFRLSSGHNACARNLALSHMDIYTSCPVRASYWNDSLSLCFAEFWIRYVRYQEKADSASAASTILRAEQVYCKRSAAFQLFAAKYYERQGKLLHSL